MNELESNIEDEQKRGKKAAEELKKNAEKVKNEKATIAKNYKLQMKGLRQKNKKAKDDLDMEKQKMEQDFAKKFKTEQQRAAAEATAIKDEAAKNTKEAKAVMDAIAKRSAAEKDQKKKAEALWKLK